ncbi:MAG: choice-of-anchor B family protein [Flavobacteriales bacterium]|nr:choice-of-anchor B family protein [Flavobacteriales bacterium]
MKINLFFNLILLLPFAGLSQYQKNVELLDHWFSDTIITNSSQVRYSSCWAFEQEGKEYGVIGSTEGSHFFELTAENKFRFIDFVQGRFVSAQAITREFKNFGTYLYASCDEGPSSLQIIDLSYLPDSVQLVADYRNELFGKVHNLFVDEKNKLLYATLVTPVVNNTESSMVPLRVFSLESPVAPTLLWEGPSDISEVHDLFVRDNLAILNCGFNGIRVYDFTNPSAPVYLNNLTIYQQQGYNHQGWLAPNNETYVFADETAGLKIKKANLNSDFSIQIQHYFGTENEPYDKTPHNIQCTNEFAFVAYYNDGLRIYDLRYNPPKEIAAYDTYLDDDLTNGFSMWGAWGVHALLPSGRILVSDRNNGFFLFDFDRNFFLNQTQTSSFSAYPNPSSTSESFVVRSYEDNITDFDISIYAATGQLISNESISNQSFVEVDTKIVSGCYFLKIVYANYLGERVEEVLRILKD